jgi:hypothetical protein
MRQKLSRHIVLAVSGWLMLTAIGHSEHVANPKASLIDMNMRRHELQNNDDLRVMAALNSLKSCVRLPAAQAPVGPMEIVPGYFNGSHGAYNPIFVAQIAVYQRFETRVSAGMNQFFVTGSDSEAQCAQSQIDSWAQASALLNYDPVKYLQAYFQVEWTLSSIAISESILMADPHLDQAMVARDIAWMNKVAHKAVDLDKSVNEHNNHHNWRGLMATAVGVISGDDGLFTWGLEVFRSAVDQINAAGAFPLEMQRFELAIHYQAFALEPLIPLAEFASRQGIDLYSYKSPTGRTISDAVVFLGNAVANPALVKPFQSQEQKLEPDSTEFSASCEFFERRFAGKLPETVNHLIQRPTYTTRIGGSTTVLGAPRRTPQ